MVYLVLVLHYIYLAWGSLNLNPITDRSVLRALSPIKTRTMVPVTEEGVSVYVNIQSGKRKPLQDIQTKKL